MVGYPLDKDLVEKFEKYSKVAGIIFLLLGAMGIVFPVIMSLATSIFFGWLLILSAFLSAYHTYNTDKKDWLGWLKAFIFFVTGALIVINPLPGVAALGIIFAVYFFMDSFASFALAFDTKPKKGWWLALLNGVLSIVLAIVFLMNWPFSSLWLVGLFVGISLVFDGAVLLTFSKNAKEIEKELDKEENKEEK